MISVVMATFNGEKYLSQQLDSLFYQSFIPAEIIVVDDCSTDGTWDILCEYATKYHQIKLYHNNINLGVVKTFERGLSLCSRDYIALADQDDVWLPNKLEILIATLGNNWLIHSDAYVVDEQLNIINESYSSIKPYHDGSLEMYYFRNDVTGCTALLKRELLKIALPFPDDTIMHDYYLALYARAYNKLIYTNHKLVKYRQHINNVIGSGAMPSYELMLSTFNKQIRFLNSLSKQPEFYCKQMEIPKSYFLSIISCKLPKLSTILFVYKKLGGAATVSMIFYTAINKRFAKFYFSLTHR